MSKIRRSGEQSLAAAEPQQRGVAAVESAAAILDVLHKAQVPLGVTSIAKASGFAPARVHHYLVSLLKTGLVHKEEDPVRYGLGPFAIRLGLTAVDRLEIQHFSAPFLHELSTETGEASFFSIWSPAGPVIVRWEQGLRPLTVFARLGTVMPLLRSATGQVYCAWGPGVAVAEAVERALLQLPPSERAAERAACKVRTEEARRMACGTTRGSMLAEVSAVAAPVFDRDGHLAGVMTVLGLLQGFDASPKGKMAKAVRRVSRQLSEKLGYSDGDE
ncbi:IclR family transcriptional regulator [Ottowia thiooxydans]|uniref:DNA-binding IclR family transcriptional regulator n=1 Tax=Ottowia thiooxydans TaxID=219182 RepID=A0ABV2Q4H1_9BURK